MSEKDDVVTGSWRKKMSTLLKIVSALFALLVGLLILLFILRPPGEPQKQPIEPDASLGPEVLMDSGALPGITWVDDIHPIFVRNKCSKCHTRGQEDVVEGLDLFALGIIDPENPANPYYSYREFVYTEGPPHIMNGESLRDGQCCWPKFFPADQQRRIWFGHPERSALLRKLERDYYDWNKPPRYFGEGLRHLWGLPMPLWQEESEQGDHHANQQEGNGEGEHDGSSGQTTTGHGHEEAGYSTSIWKRMAFRSLLWYGGGRDKLMTLPPRISARDRVMLRYWITNTIQLEDSETGIHLLVVHRDNQPVVDREIILIGNFTIPAQPEIQETFRIKTDQDGRAVLNFQVGSVVSRFWYAGLAGMNRDEYEKIILEPGSVKRITMKGTGYR